MTLHPLCGSCLASPAARWATGAAGVRRPVCLGESCAAAAAATLAAPVVFVPLEPPARPFPRGFENS